MDAEHTKRKNRAKLAREMEFWSDLMRSGAAKRRNDAFLTGETAGADMATAEMRQATGTGWEVGNNELDVVKKQQVGASTAKEGVSWWSWREIGQYQRKLVTTTTNT